jgi:hypothetical protein
MILIDPDAMRPAVDYVSIDAASVVLLRYSPSIMISAMDLFSALFLERM